MFGIKGGACGGGYSQVVPMEDINLHFTGDFHAVTAANNLLSALIDNHIKQGNGLGIANVVWKRCLDLNDRALREVRVALGGDINGTPRSDGFVITAASEIMAILCLATSIDDLKKKIGRHRDRLRPQRRGNNRQRSESRRGHVHFAERSLKAQLSSNSGRRPRAYTRRPVRQHSARLQQPACHLDGHGHKRLQVTEAGFGAELGGEKVYRYKMPSGKYSLLPARYW